MLQRTSCGLLANHLSSVVQCHATLHAQVILDHWQPLSVGEMLPAGLSLPTASRLPTAAPCQRRRGELF